MVTSLHQDEDGRSPDPDLSYPTTDQLIREVSSLKEIIYTRLNAMDRAMELFNENMTRVPTDTDRQIQQLKEFIGERFATQNEKFKGIATQFLERDTRVDQTARDTRIAVDAALQAAKEAVGKQNESSSLAILKTENAVTKQIEQLAMSIRISSEEKDGKIADIKDRVIRIESEGRGQKTAEITQQTSNTSLVGVIGLVVGAVIGTVGIVAGFFRGGG